MTISDEAVEVAIGALSPTDAATIYPDAMHAALEAAAPFIRAKALEDAADDWQQRSDTFMKTMEHMAASRDYSGDDVLRYAAYSAEANTTAYKLRSRAAQMRQE